MTLHATKICAGLWACLVVGVVFWVMCRDDQAACQRFTRELKILQACEGSKSCVFSPKDLRRMDKLQTSCQESAQ